MLEEIQESFRRCPEGFESYAAGGFVPCPPFVIAVSASELVDPGAIQLPDRYDREMLQQIRNLTGVVGRVVVISDRLAAELSEIGRQILELPDDQLKTPLSLYERQAVTHLVNLVGSPSEA
ncbi:MAG: hypothetical protein ABWY93_18705 [Mycobacterium sp.]